MKSANTGTSEGAIVLILGMILGALLTFVMIEYGTREVQKTINRMTPPDPNEPPKKVVFNGQGFVVEDVG